VKSTLHGREPAIADQRFNRVDATTVSKRRKRQTRQPRLIVDKHAAGAAINGFSVYIVLIISIRPRVQIIARGTAR
jgi:hypothetical protein